MPCAHIIGILQLDCLHIIVTTRLQLEGFELKSLDSNCYEEEEEEEDGHEEEEKERDKAEFSINNMEAIYL